jgi:hypothetical protein
VNQEVVVVREINEAKAAPFLSPNLLDVYLQPGSPDARKDDDLEIAFSAEVVPNTSPRNILLTMK